MALVGFQYNQYGFQYDQGNQSVVFGCNWLDRAPPSIKAFNTTNTAIQYDQYNQYNIQYNQSARSSPYTA
jgi:hypothetical protein